MINASGQTQDLPIVRMVRPWGGTWRFFTPSVHIGLKENAKLDLCPSRRSGRKTGAD